VTSKWIFHPIRVIIGTFPAKSRSIWDDIDHLLDDSSESTPDGRNSEVTNSDPPFTSTLSVIPTEKWFRTWTTVRTIMMTSTFKRVQEKSYSLLQFTQTLSWKATIFSDRSQRRQSCDTSTHSSYKTWPQWTTCRKTSRSTGTVTNVDTPWSEALWQLWLRNSRDRETYRIVGTVSRTGHSEPQSQWQSN
jgi:hypothetical protein